MAGICPVTSVAKPSSEYTPRGGFVFLNGPGERATSVVTDLEDHLDPASCPAWTRLWHIWTFGCQEGGDLHGGAQASRSAASAAVLFRMGDGDPQQRGIRQGCL